MVYDHHIHMNPGPIDEPAKFVEKAANAGVGGGTIISMPPLWHNNLGCDQTWAARIKKVTEFTEAANKAGGDYAAFLWLDPCEADYAAQIKAAKDAGIRGIKVICDHFYPEEHIDAFAAVADADLPLMFHSGILWDQNVSCCYNRPVAFECLIGIPGLRVSLAHISWPWTDECIALYGKLIHCKNARNGSFKLFIDATPGTPAVYRRDALRKLYFAGYSLDNRVSYGSDCLVNDYSAAWAKYWIDFDKRIIESLAEEDPAEWQMPENPFDFDPAAYLPTREALEKRFKEAYRLYTEENYLSFLNGEK